MTGNRHRRCRSPSSAVVLVAVLLSGLPVHAATAQATATDAASKTEQQITLNFQDVDIRALINTVSEVTNRNFIIDPRVKGKVTLVSGGPMDASQLYDVFLSVLQVHNFSAIPAGDVIKIIPSNVVKQQPTPLVRPEQISDAQITQVYQLQHASVQELVPILRPLLPPTSHFAAHAATNTLVFTDTTANINRLIRIIERIDVPDRRANVHVVYLKYAQATELSTIITQLVTSLSRPKDPKSVSTQVSVQADRAINALIISAPDNEFRLIQAVIEQLDIERPEEGDIHVVYLRYAKAADLVELLNEVIRSAARGGGQAQATTPSTTRVVVQADESTNALVVRAADDDFRTIRNVIDKLDVRREQVVVETIIAEVSVDKAADLGVQWSGTYAHTPTGQTTFDTEFTSLSGGLTLGFINDLVQDIFGDVVPDLEVVLRALQSDSNTNILATPTLLTLDNEAAEIVVGREIPFVTGQFVSDVSTTTSTTTPTGGDGTTGDGATTTGVVNPFQTIERKDVGLTLKITPQINEGDTIQLEISQEVSSVSPTTVQGASDLVTDKRTIEATVQADDGQIVVLGGLIRDDFVDTIEWVPILGKMPLVGALFRRKSKSAIKTNLMIFLRPKIIRSASDIAGVTKDKYRNMQDSQRQAKTETQGMFEKESPSVLPEINWEQEFPGD